MSVCVCVCVCVCVRVCVCVQHDLVRRGDSCPPCTLLRVCLCSHSGSAALCLLFVCWAA